MTDQTNYPPTIISFSDAMRLLKLARDAWENQAERDLGCMRACREIAKAFERQGEQTYLDDRAEAKAKEPERKVGDIWLHPSGGQDYRWDGKRWIGRATND